MKGITFNNEEKYIDSCEYRDSEIKNIRAIKIPENLKSPIPYGAYYDASLKGASSSILDGIIKSINEVIRTSYGYSGKCITSNGLVNFTIDFVDGKITGLLGDRAPIKLVGDNTDRFKVDTKQGQYIAISTLVACIELLIRGYYLSDWSSVGVNHKDNSAGKNDIFYENIRPDNLELFTRVRVERKSGVNQVHGSYWNLIHQFSIKPKFSCYNLDFMSQIHKLDIAGQLSDKSILSISHKADVYDTVDFD